MIDYRWTAESVVMASSVLARDLLGAIHAVLESGEAAMVAGTTPGAGSRLLELQRELRIALGDEAAAS